MRTNSALKSAPPSVEGLRRVPIGKAGQGSRRQRHDPGHDPLIHPHLCGCRRNHLGSRCEDADMTLSGATDALLMACQRSRGAAAVSLQALPIMTGLDHNAIAVRKQLEAS